MAYVPPTKDPVTSIRWRLSPDLKNKHPGDSSISKYPNPSNYYPSNYYPSNYYPSYSSPPPQGYNASYAPQQAQASIPGSTYPPPEPPQPYWHQNWPPHSSLVPYSTQPPRIPVDYPPPPLPPSASQNYPAPYSYQQPALTLTLYINPALLTPAPFYDRPASPYPELKHATPYKYAGQPPQLHQIRDDRKVRFQPGIRSPPPRDPKKVHFQPGMPPKRASDPVAPVPVRLPSGLPSRSISPPYIPPFIPPSFSPRHEPLRPPKKNTAASIRPSKNPAQSPSGSPSTRQNRVVTMMPPSSEDVGETSVQTQIKSPSLLPIIEAEKQPHVYPTPAPLVHSPMELSTHGVRVTGQFEGITPDRKVDDIRIEETDLEAKKIGQIVNRDKLEQALKNADPILKALENLVDLPKLLELVNLGAYKTSAGQPAEDATANENNAGQVSNTKERSETSVVPEIPPSPLRYSIDLVCVDGDHDDDTTSSLDPA